MNLKGSRQNSDSGLREHMFVESVPKLGLGSVVRRRDLNLMGRSSPVDFHTVYGFRRPEVELFCGLTPGLRSGLSLHRKIRSSGAARLSLHTFKARAQFHALRMKVD